MTGDPIPMRGLAGVPDVAGDHLNAQRFLEAHGRGLRRSPELGRWYIWNGSWWEEDRLDRVPEMASDTIDGLRQWVSEADGADEYKRRSSHYQASAKAGRRDSLLSVAGTDPDIVVSVDELDDQPLLLACRNGTVDLSTAELHPASRDDLITRGVDVHYDPQAVSELWLDFLGTIFAGDVDLIAYVQRLLGYCVTGVVAEHIVPVLVGSGANGKSTLLGVMQDLLGDHAITAPEGLVIQTAREAHPERLAALRGCRLVVSDELEERAVLAESMVKMLSGGDTISARELYGRRFNFRPSHKVVLATNHRPRVNGTDRAIWRRLRVVPFGVEIPADRQDLTLRRRLIDEHGPAVLAWLVQGAQQWHTDGLREVEAVRCATEDYRHTEDTVGAWVEDCTVPVDGVRTKVGDLWESWRTWCERSNERPGRKQDFSRALADHGMEIETHQGYRLTRGIGLAVRSDEDSPRTSPISTPTGTLGVRPNETSDLDENGALKRLAEQFPGSTVEDA
jgi:putative DNA primase/helicase